MNKFLFWINIMGKNVKKKRLVIRKNFCFLIIVFYFFIFAVFAVLMFVLSCLQ